MLRTEHGLLTYYSVTYLLTDSVATAGLFPLDLGFFGVVWVSGYFCQ